MAHTVYVHGSGGVSGVGLLGALVDLGASLQAVQEGWQRLQLPEIQVTSERCALTDHTATRLHCSNPAAEAWLAGHTYDSLVAHIDRSALTRRIKRRLLDVLECFADAVSTTQSSQDAAAALRSPDMTAVLYWGSGVCTALEVLNIEQFLTAPVNLGSGLHPLTLALLQGMPVYGETTTLPSVTVDGAAILAGVADGYGPLPSMTLRATGFGAWAADAEAVQSLQMVRGDTVGDAAAERIAVLEANIDDMNPEFYDAVFERLLAHGALDVTLTPLLMKKGRPANKLTVLAPLAATASLTRAMLYETSTFGVRIYEVWRQKLERFWRPVETSYGTIPIKCGLLDGSLVQAAPEYEACKRLAQQQGVPVRLIYAEASRLAAAWLQAEAS